MLVTCNNIGRAFIYWLRHHSTIEERVTICQLLDCDPADPGCVPNWQPTGASNQCIEGTWRQPQIDGCGNNRLFDLGTPCGGPDPCVPGFIPAVPAQFRCYEGDYEQLYVDKCDPALTQWTYLRPVNYSTSSFCGPGLTIIDRTTNVDCGGYTDTDTGVPCGCTEDWVAVDTRCLGGMYQTQWHDNNNCGLPDFWDSGVPVTWVAVGAPYCSGGTYKQDQEDNCGNTRTIDTGTPCCIPNWQPTGSYTCHDGRHYQVEEDGCGNNREVDIGAEVWTDVTPLETDCISHVEYKKQTNQCGDTQWVSTGTPCGYSPLVLNVTQSDGFHQFAYPCNAGNPETISGLSASASATASGGSGNLTITVSYTPVVQDFPVSVTDTGSSLSISDTRGSIACNAPSATGETEYSYTFTVTDNITGLTDSRSGSLMISYVA